MKLEADSRKKEAIHNGELQKPFSWIAKMEL